MHLPSDRTARAFRPGRHTAPGRARRRGRAKISGMSDERAGRPASPDDLIDVASSSPRTTRSSPIRPSRPAGRLRHLRAPRLGVRRRVQRGAHPRHHPGHLRVPEGAGLRRAAVHRPRHPRALRTRLGQRAGGAGGQRRHGPGRRGRSVHPTPAVSHAILTANREGRRSRRRDRRHAVAQPAAGRRVQVQPAGRRPGRHRRHRLDRRPGQRAAPRRAQRRPPGAAGPGAARAQSYDFLGTYVDDLPAVVDIDAIRNAGVRIGATRWAAPASTTGRRSPSGTGSTSPS